MSGKIINYTTIIYGKYRDPTFTIGAGAALIHAFEDNVDKIMMDLEQSKKSSSQLKDTLRKEREENNLLKIKLEDIQEEIKSSKDELQVLQIEKRSMETAQECLEKVEQEYQELRAEKEQLLGRIGDLELLKATLEEGEIQSQA